LTVYRPPSEPVESVRTLLAEHLSHPIEELRQLPGGEISQTFSFDTAGRGYILKLNHDKMDANFEKEAFVSREFSSDVVPIPEVVAFGRHEHLHFIVLERASGTPMDQLPAEELPAAVPALIETLAAIHSTDVSRFEGHGLFDGDGRGFFESWRSNLEFVREEERDGGFYGKWHTLFDETFLEREVFDSVFATMMGLADDCPEDRWLVHGDFGFGNLLVEGDRVTAVIDWLEAKFADFVYDIAWLDFWAPGTGMADRIARDYAARGIEVPEFAERLRCYQSYIGLDAMRFFAKSDQEGSYRFARDRILSLLGAD